MNIGTIFDGIEPGNRSERGFAGEYFARHTIQNSGYVVTIQREKKRGDLQVADIFTGECWKVEVKTARRRKDGKWTFQVKGTGNARTDYRHSDYVMLLAVIGGGKVASYLIPVSKLGTRNTITISNLNAGKWTDYRVKEQVKI